MPTRRARRRGRPRASGFAAGPLYGPTMAPERRRAWLLRLGLACLLMLLVLRGFNVYGETLPWVPGEDATRTLMSWLNLTKYPPSLDFLLLALGLVLMLMRVFDKLDNGLTRAIRCYGGEPMFFYLLHLYVLLVMQWLAVGLVGANHGDRYGVDNVGWIWTIATVLALLL
jgi:uncharacterized membrane protein